MVTQQIMDKSTTEDLVYTDSNIELTELKRKFSELQESLPGLVANSVKEAMRSTQPTAQPTTLAASAANFLTAVDGKKVVATTVQAAASFLKEQEEQKRIADAQLKEARQLAVRPAGVRGYKLYMGGKLHTCEQGDVFLAKSGAMKSAKCALRNGGLSEEKISELLTAKNKNRFFVFEEVKD